jgi:hypothetical protein
VIFGILALSFIVAVVVVAMIVRVASKFVAGPLVPWRTGIYWGVALFVVGGGGGALLNRLHLPHSTWLAVSSLGIVCLHVGLGGLFMVNQVRAADGSRLPWAWGAKITGLAGLALLVIGYAMGAAIGFFGLWGSV